MTTFDDAFTYLMGNEGKYSDNPNDPGGATMWGITENVARAHGYEGSMENLPQSLAKKIAKQDYWDPFQGDSLPGAVALQVFDGAYNSGVRQAVKWLQLAVDVSVDGVVGPTTLTAVQARNPDKVCMAFLANRLNFMTNIGGWDTFSKGWSRRIARNLLRAAQ